jgi:DNA polymerase
MPSLEAVYADIEADPFWDYLRLPGIKFVPGYGQRTRPKVLLVGEAPGATENARGRPFCGPSGRVLDHLMEQAGLRLDPTHAVGCGCRLASGPEGVPGCLPGNAFVTNVVKYRPPGNATPNPAAINYAKESLRAEYRALGSPPIIICVGSVAHSAIHPDWPVLTVSRCRSFAAKPRHPETGEQMEKGPWIISQLHPAYGLRKGKSAQLIMNSDWQEMGKMFSEMEIL